ncbi:MAG TPA: NADPH-dependent F420 reductase [Actinomycetota bacterium]
MAIAIVGGTGDEGFGLALRLARAGEDVIIGSRAQDRAAAAAQKAEGILGSDVTVRGMENPEAVAGAEVVFVTVPFGGQADTYRGLKDAWPAGTVICDCTSPLATAVGGRAWQVITPWHGSAAEQAKALLPPGARLVSGFQTVSGEALQELDRPMQGDVLLCGAEAEAKATVGALVERIPELHWVDGGPLSMARIVETFTAVLVQVNRNYGIRETGVAFTGREAWGAPPPKQARGGGADA